MQPDALAQWCRRTEEDIADFEARMREMPFSHTLGERVELHGEAFEIADLVQDGMPGYWLRDGESRRLFLPLDMEGLLRGTLH